MRSSFILLTLALWCGPVWAQPITLWIGTGGPREGSEGIYRTELEPTSGHLSPPSLAAPVNSPGFLALSPNGRHLYATARLGDQGGGVAAFRVSEDTQSLAPINRQAIGDGGAAHLAVDHTGTLLFTAQYGGGSVAVFPLAGDGAIGARTQLIEHTGSGPNAARQQGPHPHWVGVSPDNRFLLVPDLGADRIFVYAIDHEQGLLRPNGFGQAPAGAGPRHLKFHPNGRFVFVLNELDLTVSTFDFDAHSGALSHKSVATSLPPSLWEIPNKASEIRVHPSGRFVYTANRGHDSITAFRVNPDSGGLTLIEREAIRGAWPRNFNIDPSGQWLVACGRYSGTLSVFAIDPARGDLKFNGHVAQAPAPICALFHPTSTR